MATVKYKTPRIEADLASKAAKQAERKALEANQVLVVGPGKSTKALEAVLRAHGGDVKKAEKALAKGAKGKPEAAKKETKAPAAPPKPSANGEADSKDKEEAKGK